MTKNPFLQQYTNYIIIAVVSVLSLVFFPMLGSTVGMGFILPTTLAGWVVYVATKLCVGLLNLIIFHSFIQQSKINAKDHPNYIKAQEILRSYKSKEYIPLSPKQFFGKEYSIKGTTIFITSILSAIALSQAILTYDIMTFLTYLFTVIMGVIAGIFEMRKCYEWYIADFLDYAEYYQKKVKEEQEQEKLQGENKDVSIQQQRIPQSCGTSAEE